MVDAQDSAAAWRQLIVMAFVFQLLLGVNRNIEREGLVGIYVGAGCSKLQLLSLDAYIIAVVVAAVLLRADIIFVHGCSGSPETAMTSGVMLVNIGFPWPHPIIADLFHALIQKQTQADPGKCFDFRVFRSLEIKQDPAIRENGYQARNPEKMEHLFDRFYRVDEARNSDGHHYGLGLSIAKAVAEKHGGIISVACQDSKVRFTVSIPVKN